MYFKVTRTRITEPLLL